MMITYTDRNVDPMVAVAQLRRSRPSVAEKLLWMLLKSGQFHFRFRRQRIVGDQVVDFYCPKLGLAIQIRSARQDARRHLREVQALRRAGVCVIDLRAGDFLKKPLPAVARITAEIVRLAEAGNVAPSDERRCFGVAERGLFCKHDSDCMIPHRTYLLGREPGRGRASNRAARGVVKGKKAQAPQARPKGAHSKLRLAVPVGMSQLGPTVRDVLEILAGASPLGDPVARIRAREAMDVHPRLSRIALAARSPTLTRAVHRLWERGAVDPNRITEALTSAASRSEPEYVEAMTKLDGRASDAFFEARLRTAHRAAVRALATRRWSDLKLAAPGLRVEYLIVLPRALELLHPRGGH